MKVLVPVKRVVDPYVRIRINREQTAVDTAHLKMTMNPFDEIAVEEAVRWKEQGSIDEIIAISIGNTTAQETLRAALALGADRAVLLETSVEMQPLGVAKLLQAWMAREPVEVVVMGKQSIDDDYNQTGQMLAGLMGWPQATFASKIELTQGYAEVTREVDEGSQTVRLTLPAVITADLRLNTPRYATLPNIMKAKQKSLTVIAADTLGVAFAPKIAVTRVTEPPTRQTGERVTSVEELVRKLREEAKVIL